MAQISRSVWLVALVGAVMVFAAAAALVLREDARRHAPGAGRAPDAGTAACAVPQNIPRRALPHAEDPPVILWATGEVRLFLDGQAAFSPPDAPKRFAVGEHTLRLESPGQELLEIQVRLAPFVPALFHAELDPRTGLDLVELGAVCSNCQEALSPLGLGVESSAVGAEALLSSASAALRKGDWVRAGAFLRGVSAKERKSALFHRLAAATYVDAEQPQKARAELASLPPREREELRKLTDTLAALEKAEQARQAGVVVLRWNKVTERFQALVQRFGPQAPGPTQAASLRLGELSTAFEAAQHAQDQIQQERLLRAAEEALASVGEQIRAARPGDCPFQAEVVATLVQ